jgi:putative nucleotidyltransferase with HDIG domain
MPSAVLLVDDERSVLSALKRALRVDGHEIHTASSGAEGLQILQEVDTAVILCDHSMPFMTGAEFLAKSVDVRPEAIRITLTGNADLETARASINDGKVSRFLLKPWDDDQLRAAVRDGVKQFDMQREIRHLHDLTTRQRDELELWNHSLEEKVRDRTNALQTAYDETLDALVVALDSREHATAGHSRRVALYCLFLAIEAGVGKENLDPLYRGALLHDIGKIGVPDAVLLKPGKLDPDERKIIEQHVVTGGVILRRIGFLKPAMPIPLYHHERFDGLGYSAGLSEDAIPIEARIFAVVDVYDALRSDRPYKSAMPHEKASDIIVADSGTHFDPRIVAAFQNVALTQWNELHRIADHIAHFHRAYEACVRVREEGGKRESVLSGVAHSITE